MEVCNDSLSGFNKHWFCLIDCALGYLKIQGRGSFLWPILHIVCKDFDLIIGETKDEEASGLGTLVKREVICQMKKG